MSERPNERTVIRNQAKQARARFAVKCKRLWKQCCTLEESLQEDLEIRTAKAVRRDMRRHGADGRHTEDGRIAEITFDLILRARAKMVEETVNGAEDSTVSEVFKDLAQENVYEIMRCSCDSKQ